MFTSCVQDLHRSHYEIVTSAAASIPMDVLAYPERRSWPFSPAYLEQGSHIDLIICVHICLADIASTTIRIPCNVVFATRLKTGKQQMNPNIPDLKMSCKHLTLR